MDLPDVAELSGRVTRVMGLNPGPMTLGGSATYLVGTGKRRVLVDSGQGEEGYAALLEGAMRAAGCEGIEAVLLTHRHVDHVGGVGQVLALCGGARLLKARGGDADEGGEEEGDEAWACGRPVEPLEDGQVIRTEGATLRVVHTPGHTSDHAALLLEEEGAVFSGDCVLGEGTAAFSDLYTYMGSLRALLALAPRRMYPGHGPVIEDPMRKLTDYIEHRNKREKQLLDALLRAGPGGATAMGLVRTVYAGVPESVIFAALGNVLNHLSKLEREGRAARGAVDADAEREAADMPPRLSSLPVSVVAAVWRATGAAGKL